MDSFRFPELLSFFDHTNLSNSDPKYCSNFHFASYKKLKFNLNDAQESKQDNQYISDEVPLIDQDVDLENLSESSYLRHNRS